VKDWVTGKFTGLSLIVLSIGVMILFSVVAKFRPLSGLESVLLQSFSLAIGLLGSFIIGRESVRNAARDVIKPHARSAFRRLLSLYSSLSRLATTIQEARPMNKSPFVESTVLDKLEVMVIEQIATADDALEDWRDIVPEDVAELRTKLEKVSTMESKK
jgi:hypothetical protein